MTPLRLFPLLLVLVLGFPLPTPTHAQSDAPYIYYYSDLLKGWVIERADGTDGRVIGQGLNADFNHIVDVSWSPSGRWMSWQAGMVRSQGYQGQAVRTDGSKLITQLNNLPGGLYSLVWSPTEDLLAGTYVEVRYPRFIGHMVIIDPETDSIVAQTIVESPFDESYGLKVVWLEDGSGIYLTGGGSPTVVPLLYKSGQTKTLLYAQLDFSFANDSDGYVTAPIPRPRDGLSGAPVGIANLLTGQIVPILAPEGWYKSSYRLYWNPPGTYALLLTWECGGDIPCYYDSRQADFSLVERATGKHTTLGSNYWISRGGADDIRFINRPDSELMNPLWSPDGSRAIFLDRYRFVDGQQSGQLMLVNVQDATITPLTHLDDIYLWQWIGNDALLLKRDADNHPYRYDLSTFEVQALTPFRPEYGWYQLSPSGRYLGGDSYDGYRIIDLQTGKSIDWVLNGNPCANEVDYFWNVDESWFLTGQLAYCTDGPIVEFGGISVHDIDETTNRELTVCSDMDICAGFLPERAIPHLRAAQTESVFLQPEATLGSGGSHEWIISWSPDGHFLVTASQSLTQSETGRNSLNFWDMTELPRLIRSGKSSADCVPCTAEWLADNQQMIWSGNSITEVWDATTGRLLRQERIFPPPPLPEPHSHSYAPLVCEEALNLRPNPVEPNSTLAWVNDRWLRFSNGTKNCSRDGKWLMVFSNDNRLTALNPQTMRTFDLGEVSLQWNNTFFEYQPTSPLLLATAGNSPYNSRMELFDIELGQWLTVPINFFTSNAALSPDGRWIAAAGAQTVTIWDIAQIRARQVVE